MTAGTPVPSFAALAPAPEPEAAPAPAPGGTGTMAPAGTGDGTGQVAPAAPGTVEVAPAPAKVTGTSLVPTAPVPVQRTGTGARRLRSLRNRLARLADDQKTHRTFWHRIWEAVWVTQPESFPAHRAHLKSKAWLEPWMDGWVRVVFDKQNILFGILIARPAKAALRAVVFTALNTEKLFDRQYRFWIAVGLFLPCFIIYLLNH